MGSLVKLKLTPDLTVKLVVSNTSAILAWIQQLMGIDVLQLN